MTLLTREKFRLNTFSRDKNTCVVPGCGQAAVDPHHIIDRELWGKDDPYPEGYLLNNGASLCETHHLHAEQNDFPPQALRRWLSIPTVLPHQLDPNKIWDKWGNEIECATNTKWPRTPYLTISPSIDTKDHIVNAEQLLHKPLVITTKMDGANVTITKEKVTARNGDTADHPMFAPLKAMHASFRWSIPENLMLYGEWLFAQHSISYKNQLALDNYLLIFGVYEPETQLLWSWNEVVAFCKENEFAVVPIIGLRQYSDSWKLLQEVWEIFDKVVKSGHEGIVIRNIFPFHHSQYTDNSCKLVRDNHLQTGDDWKNKPIVKNEKK